MDSQIQKVIDWQWVRELVADDEDIVETLCDSFLTNARELLRRISEAARQLNAAELEAAAHRFKSTMASFGVRPAVECLQQLEDAGRHGRLNDLDRIMIKMEYYVDCMVYEIRGRHEHSAG